MLATIAHAKTNGMADFTGTVTVNNSSGGTQTVSASQLVLPSDWNSSHAATLSMQGADIASLISVHNGITGTSNASGLTIGVDAAQFFEPFSLLNTNSTMIAFPAGTWYLEPFMVPIGLHAGRIGIAMTYNSANFSHGVVGSAAQTGVATKTARFMNRIAIYARGTGDNSTRLESYYSAAADLSATHSITYSSTGANDVRVTNAITYGFLADIDSTGGVVTSTVSTSGSILTNVSTMASTLPNSLITGGAVQDWFTGSVFWRFPLTTDIPPGEYWLAHMHSISSGGGTTGGGNYLAGTCFNSSPGRMALLDPVLTAFKRLGDATIGNSSTLAVPFKGLFATTTSVAPLGIATSDMRATTGRIYWNYMQTSG